MSDDTDRLVLLELRLERLEGRNQQHCITNYAQLWLRGVLAILVLLCGAFLLFAQVPIPPPAFELAYVALVAFLGADGVIKFRRYRNDCN